MKKRTPLLIPFCIILFLSIFTLPASASDTEEITEALQRFFQEKNSIYMEESGNMSLSREETLNLYSSRFSGIFTDYNYSIDFFFNRMAFFNESYRVCQKNISHYTYQIEINSFSPTASTAAVRVTERVNYLENAMLPSAAGIPAGWNISYTISLQKNGSWKISRIYTNETFYAVYYNDTEAETATAQLDPVFSSLYEDYRTSADELTHTVPTALDVSRANAYAQSYALQYNPLFPSYQGKGGDCVNFTSQCIYAGLGGDLLSINKNQSPMVDWGVTGTRSWYHTSKSLDTASNWSWTSTKGLYNHILSGSPGNAGLYGIEIPVSNVRPGDIIQIDYQNDGEYDHTVFVSHVQNEASTNSYSQILTSGHTSDRLNYPLNQFGYQGSYRALRVLGSVQTIPGTWIETEKGFWYRHDDNGYTRNEWEKINGQWYYFNQDGYMYTGWLQKGSTWYYLHPADGHMVVTHEIIDGVIHRFDESGAWIGSVPGPQMSASN